MSCDLFLEPEVHAARDKLPGKLRQRVRRAITATCCLTPPVRQRYDGQRRAQSA